MHKPASLAPRLLAVALGTLLFACSGLENGHESKARDSERTGKTEAELDKGPSSPPRIRGYLAATVGARGALAGPAPAAQDVFLPGITITLRDRATTTTVAAVKTDLSGRFNFPPQAPGRYDICWSSKTLPAGCAPNPVSLGDRLVHVGTIRVPKFQIAGHVPVWGKVTLGDGAPLRVLEPHANTNAFARVSLLSKTGAVLDRVNVNNFGEYFLPKVPVGQDVALRANHEAALTQQPIAPGANLGNAPEHRIDLLFKNRAPRLAELRARDGSGIRVRTGKPGSIVLLDAEATEPDGDTLKYRWELSPGAGSLSNSTSSHVEWTLPATEGEYSVTVLAYDGNGGYAKSTLPLGVHDRGVLFAGQVAGTDTPSVAGAEISVNGARAVSDAQGRFRFFVKEVDRYVLNIHKRGYGLYSKIFDDGVENGRFTLTRASVQTVDPRQPIDVTNRRVQSDCPGQLVSAFDWAKHKQLLQPQWQDGKNNPMLPPKDRGAVVLPSPNTPRPRECGPGVRVQIPANGLVDESGNPPAGTVDVELATIDLESPEQMPGDESVRMSDGSIKVMRSFGAGSFEFWSGNTRYNLRSGVQAQVTIPVDARQRLAGATPPATIPLLYYNEKTGEWYQEGDMALAGTSYQAKVKHFSVINADEVKVNQACLDVHSPLLPPTYQLEITIPEGPSLAPKVRQYAIANGAPSRHVIVNLPTNTNVTLVPFDSTTNVPFGVFVVNTGGAQFPTVPNIPVDYDACSTDVTLSPIALPQDPLSGEFLHGLFTFGATNLSELNPAVPADNALLTAIDDATEDYYASVDPNLLRTTLGGFQSTHNFPIGEIRGVYANGGDLGFGRDMRCVKNGANVACTVTNYGNNTTDDQADADAALAGTTPVATVAMEYAPIEDDLLADPVVKFFVYDGSGQRINAADLDGKGLRPIPQLCMVCHGGEFPNGPTTGVPIFGGADDAKLGSVFLPFDLAYYEFPASPGFDKASQQAEFKSLNEDIVLATNTTTAIQEVITRMYAGGPTQDETFTVAGWSGSPAQSAMYENVVARACRTCHAALPAADLQFDTSAEFIDRLGAVETRVCQQHVMPHSLITHNLFWQSINPNMVAQLQSFGDTYATPVNGWAGNKCGVFTAGGTTPPSQFLTNVHPIFDNNGCTGCHVGGSPPAGLNLSAALAYGEIVNTPSTQLPGMDRIEPSNVAQSYLLHKIKGTQGAVGGSGVKMPPGGSVPAGDITTIETWVNASAPP